VERVPEPGVFVAGAGPGLRKNPGVWSADSLEAAAHHVGESAVRDHDDSVGPELDGRLGPADGGDPASTIAMGHSPIAIFRRHISRPSQFSVRYSLAFRSQSLTDTNPTHFSRWLAATLAADDRSRSRQ
jgi:hypothetical protein